MTRSNRPLPAALIVLVSFPAAACGGELGPSADEKAKAKRAAAAKIVAAREKQKKAAQAAECKANFADLLDAEKELGSQLNVGLSDGE